MHVRRALDGARELLWLRDIELYRKHLGAMTFDECLKEIDVTRGSVDPSCSTLDQRIDDRLTNPAVGAGN